MKTLRFPTELWFQENALAGLRKFKQERIFIVTDPFIEQSGMLDMILPFLEGNDYQVFNEIVPDPPIEIVVKGIQAYQAFSGTMMLAVGGGSAIDAAKAMKYFAAKVFQQQTRSFIAIPTTSGTGSEVTNFSVITLADQGIKIPLVTDDIQPDIAILDTKLVMSVPPKITADTGMDVLTHVLEAYVSTEANDITDALCEKVVPMVFKYLPKAYHNGNDVEAREKMHLASCLAGMAFNIASLGINHAIAHSIGGQLHIAHGRINAVLLPGVVNYNAQDKNATEKYTRLANLLESYEVSHRSGVQVLIRRIKQLQKQLDIPTNLVACGVTETDIEQAATSIAQGALNDQCLVTNPIQPTAADILMIIKEISI